MWGDMTLLCESRVVGDHMCRRGDGSRFSNAEYGARFPVGWTPAMRRSFDTRGGLS
jgi:hypothetical protein